MGRNVSDAHFLVEFIPHCLSEEVYFLYQSPPVDTQAHCISSDGGLDVCTINFR